MKNKKIILYMIVAALMAGLFSSCAIDRKCPAYTQAQTEVCDFKA